MEKNESGHYRGLHVVIISPNDYKIKHAKVFDTYETSARFNKFIKDSVPLGYIVIAACKDECLTGFSFSGKEWFASMGSLDIWELGYQCGFAFIGIYGYKAEKPNEI